MSGFPTAHAPTGRGSFAETVRPDVPITVVVSGGGSTPGQLDFSISTGDNTGLLALFEDL